MDKGSHGRKDRLIKQKRHDAYQGRHKWPEPAQCIDCGALLSNGRWTWKQPPNEKAVEVTCPACRRIVDRYPAGYIEIKGDFYTAHQKEILNLIRNVEKQEKGEHPLERIMTTSDESGHTLVTTTGVHIARRIGEALSQSYKGAYSFQYADGEKRIRVYWER